jgi:transaldolase
MTDVHEQNPLQRLYAAGQSIWYDNISRQLLTGGGLATMIKDDAVVGVTSNPTIFHRAISEGVDYDEALGDLARAGLPTSQALDVLMAQDIAMAADILLPVWQQTGGKDGWVSIEVSPHLAHDTDATVADAHRIAYLVDRPNILVKVPATKAGVEAVRRLVAGGACINVTLIFSLARHREVMEAYLSGLEELARRIGEGEELPDVSAVAGVASFFVSRVDSKIDVRLEKKAEELRAVGREEEAERCLALRGTAAVANATLAYQEFLEVFSGPRWEALATEDARPQRPLWASTGTKNPHYSDVKYVEELIGPLTVNTMPEATLVAFRDHGIVAPSLTADVEGARERLAALEQMGIDMDAVTTELEAEGVKAFVDSWDQLLAVLERRLAEST